MLRWPGASLAVVAVLVSCNKGSAADDAAKRAVRDQCVALVNVSQRMKDARSGLDGGIDFIPDPELKRQWCLEHPPRLQYALGYFDAFFESFNRTSAHDEMPNSANG